MIAFLLQIAISAIPGSSFDKMQQLVTRRYAWTNIIKLVVSLFLVSFSPTLVPYAFFCVCVLHFFQINTHREQSGTLTLSEVFRTVSVYPAVHVASAQTMRKFQKHGLFETWSSGVLIADPERSSCFL